MHTNGSNYQASAILPPANHLLWRDEAPDNIRVVRVNNVVELNACWPWVKERLEIIKKKDKSAGNWIPEHVRHLLILQFSNNSRVELYLAVENETNVLHGFIVTNVLIDPLPVHPDDASHLGRLAQSRIDREMSAVARNPRPRARAYGRGVRERAVRLDGIDS